MNERRGTRRTAAAQPGRRLEREAAASVAAGGRAAMAVSGVVCLVSLLILAGCLGDPQSGRSASPPVEDTSGTSDDGGDTSETGEEPAERRGYPLGDPNRTDDGTDAVSLPDDAQVLDYRASHQQPAEGVMDAGVYVSDIDRDGDSDLLLTGNETARLYRNADGGFVEQRDFALDAPPFAALFFDHDNDGWDDLYLLNRGSTQGTARFYENVGGTFERREVGLARSFRGPRGATAADLDGDGCLDVYVYQAGDWTRRRAAGFGNASVPLDEDNGAPNRVFDGDCTSFDEVHPGVAGQSWSLAASAVDFTGDGRADIHVANDFNNDVLYVNHGNWSFDRRVLPETTDRNGMASEVADVNGDGRPDIFVSNVYVPPENRTAILRMRYGDRVRGNNLLINQGNGSFVDRAAAYGVRRGSWGWAAVLEDLDNDRDDDLVLATARASPSAGGRNLFWLREGNTFEPARRSGITEDLGTMGLATLRADRDAVPALAFGVVHGAPFYVYGPGDDTGHWIDVTVSSDGGPAIGSTVTVATEHGRQVERVHASTDYLAQDTRTVHVGLGNATSATVSVVFPDGERVVRDVTADRRIVVNRSTTDGGTYG